MPIYTLVALGILALLLAAFAVGLVVAVLRNMVRGQAFRRQLGMRVSRLRLSKMLEYLGIDRERYLHHHRVADIRKHMDRCKACEETDACDRTISTPGREGASIDFCPNSESLDKT